MAFNLAINMCYRICHLAIACQLYKYFFQLDISINISDLVTTSLDNISKFIIKLIIKKAKIREE